MLNFKDANVLIVKEIPNRNISISSLMLSLGVKPYRMVNLNDPIEAVKRTFHHQFDILICDQTYRDSQLTASDIVEQLQASKAIGERTVIVMDCHADMSKDYSYYLADVPLLAESNLREVTEELRTQFERKNRIAPMLQPKPWDSEQEMEKRFQSFSQKYPEWQYDLLLHRGHYCLANQRTKEATGLYGLLIKQRRQKDPTLEVCYFLNALALNGQAREALVLHKKFAAGQRKLGQPFTDMGALLQFSTGNLDNAYQCLSSSKQEYGMNLAQRTEMALLAVALEKYDQALELFANNLKCAEQLNRDLTQHTMNYLFALLMSWMANCDAGALYQKKFKQLREQVSRGRLSEAQNVQLALLTLHADYLVEKSWQVSAQKQLISLSSMLPQCSMSFRLHALYISAMLGNERVFNHIQQSITCGQAVLTSCPLKSSSSLWMRQLNWEHFKLVTNRTTPVTAQYPSYACQ